MQKKLLIVILVVIILGVILSLFNSSKKNVELGNNNEVKLNNEVTKEPTETYKLEGENMKNDQLSPTQTPSLSSNTVKYDGKPLPSPQMSINKNKTYQAILKTSAGDITILLDTQNTPITVNNFIYLSNSGLYDNTIFHRVIKGFMIQGGDPNGDGTGNPGYKFNDEKFSGEYDRGVVAMANSGPNTNGSQFFIMHEQNPLPKNYVIFGKVTKGLDTVDKIANSQVTNNAFGELSKPISPVNIKSVEVISE